MNSFFLKLNTFLLMIWGEIIVIISSIILSGIIINIMQKIFLERFIYKTYESIKISLTLFIVVIVQYLYKNLLDIFLKKHFTKIILVINSSAISILLAEKIIKKTIFSKYPIFYFFLFISMIIPFLSEILHLFKTKKRK